MNTDTSDTSSSSPHVLFCGNFVKDNIIHFRKSRNEMVSNSCSLGGSVTFGSLAFSRYISSLGNQMMTPPTQATTCQQQQQQYQIRIVSNIDATCLNHVEQSLIHQMFRIFDNDTLNESILLPESFHLPLLQQQKKKGSAANPPHKDGGDDMHDINSVLEPNYLTSYNIVYNDDNILTNERTMTLGCRGPSMNLPDWLLSECLSSSSSSSQQPLLLPAAIFFVPVAAEFDENTVSHVMKHVAQEFDNNTNNNNNMTYPLVCCDIQGFLRTFESCHTNENYGGDNGLAVVAHSSSTMRRKLSVLGEHVFLLKADLNEANAVLRDEASSEQYLSPLECAKRLHKLFGFQVICITMGPQGCLVSCKHSGNEISIRGDVTSNSPHPTIATEYVPAFQPKCTVDETGCGDTFLSCLVAELLLQLRENHSGNSSSSNNNATRRNRLHTDQLFHAVKMATAATSFVVECVGPQGFATREMAICRIKQGEVIKSEMNIN